MNRASVLSKKRKKILVADNSHTIRLVIQKYLKDKYEVIEAENGKEAVALGGCEDIFMTLISYEFEDFNGYEIITKIRKKFDAKTLPIIFNTSHNKRGDILRALDAGANDYILKPFPKELLISKIHKLERSIPVRDIKQSQIIAKIPFFHGVPESQVAFAINTCSETIKMKRGEIICRQDDKNQDLFVLIEGKCDVIFNDKKVSEILAVDSIGEIGFLEGKNRSATVVATEVSKLIVFKKELFDEFLNEDRAISEIICKNVIHTLGERIKRSNSLIEQLKALAHEHLTY